MAFIEIDDDKLYRAAEKIAIEFPRSNHKSPEDVVDFLVRFYLQYKIKRVMIDTLERVSIEG